jgi:hypothetical protein
MSVDLPAPFSPQIAWTSPAATVIDTSLSAFTPGNSLVMERISRIGTASGIVRDLLVVSLSSLSGLRSEECDRSHRLNIVHPPTRLSITEGRYRSVIFSP